jgi:hypothetical protein
MAYRRSVREIPLSEEPHASVIAALLPSPGESPVALTESQQAHLDVCLECQSITGIHSNTSNGQLGAASLPGTEG